jgi:hypothetical protein
MSNKKSKSRKVDFLRLSASEKAKFMRTTKKVLRQRIEEAKLWRTLIESDGIIVNGSPVAV